MGECGMNKLENINNFIKKHVIFVLILIILLQLITVIIFGTFKESYHVDELFTFGLSNSYFQPFIKYEDVSMKWLSHDFYNNYFTVQINQRFTYDSVYYNQVNDVHPPFYYYLIHTVCSFFPNIYSKWFGIGINMVFLAGTVVVLFYLSRLITDNNSLSLVICALYGFSAGAISNSIFIRMYMMLTFFIVLTTYLHGLLIVNKKNMITTMIFIMFVNISGFLTQYFFAIYAFFIAFGYVLFLNKIKARKEMLIYIVAMIGCVIISIIIFPECLNHILLGHIGNNVMGNFVIIEDFLRRFGIFIKLLCKSLIMLPISLSAIVITILYYIKNYKKVLNGKKFELYEMKAKYFSDKLAAYEKMVMFDILIYSTFVTFLVIVKIALFYEGRYIAFILPNISIITLFAVYIVMYNIFKNSNKIIFSLLTVIIFFITVASNFRGNVDYLYQNKANDLYNSVSNYQDYDAYCLATKRVDITIAMPLLSQHLKSCYVSNSKDILTKISEDSKTEPIIIYFPHWDEGIELDKEILDDIVDRSEYNTYEQISSKRENGLSTNIFILK
jgi:hypothetical protein